MTDRQLELKHRIILALCREIHGLTTDSGLLAAVNSYDDTLDDETLLDILGE